MASKITEIYPPPECARSPAFQDCEQSFLLQGSSLSVAKVWKKNLCCRKFCRECPDKTESDNRACKHPRFGEFQEEKDGLFCSLAQSGGGAV